MKTIPKKYQEVLEDKNLEIHTKTDSLKFLEFMIENEKGLNYLLKRINEYERTSDLEKMYLFNIMKMCIKKRLFLDEILEIVNSNKIKKLSDCFLSINYRVNDLHYVYVGELISKGYSLKGLKGDFPYPLLRKDYPTEQEIEKAKERNRYNYHFNKRLEILKEREQAYNLFVNLHNTANLRDIYEFSSAKRKRFEEVAMIWYDNYTFEEVNNDLAQKFCDALYEIRTRRYKK